MASTKKPAGPATKGLRITAKRESFYSAGISTPFGFEPREIALSDLDKEQVEALREDPYLVVADVDIADTKAEKA